MSRLRGKLVSDNIDLSMLNTPFFKFIIPNNNLFMSKNDKYLIKLSWQKAEYCDFGNFSECYFNGAFLELETIATIEVIVTGKSATHIETWELYQDIDRPENETALQSLVDKLDLE